MQYGWSLEFSNSNVCSTIGHGNFLITKSVQPTIHISTSLKATHMVHLGILYPWLFPINFLINARQETSLSIHI